MKKEKLNDLFLNKLNDSFKLNKIDLGSNSVLKKKGMKFNLSLYEIENIGQLFIMNMKAMFGLMKMETAILVIDKKDMPLINYDYIKAFKKETLLFEFYKTNINDYNNEFLNKLKKIKEDDNDLLNYETEPNWYDDILYDITYRKTGKNLLNRFNNTANKYLNEIINQINLNDLCDINLKREKIDDFSINLYNNGGPAVNMFKKLFGEELTKKVVLEFMYGRTKVK